LTESWKKSFDSLYNLVIFPAGLGDGVYATWAGLDSHDHPICLLTNFALTDQIS